MLSFLMILTKAKWERYKLILEKSIVYQLTFPPLINAILQNDIKSATQAVVFG